MLADDRGRKSLGAPHAMVAIDPPASGTTRRWSAPAGEIEMGAIIRAGEEATTPGYCFAKYDETEVCITESDFVNADRRVPISTTCSAGSGSFRLLPVHTKDRDHDGAKTIIFRALQKSGTGSLTAAAWITAITPTQTRGRPLRAIKAGASYRLSTSDALQNPTLVSSPLSLTSTTQFNAGIIGGNVPFVSEEVPTNTYLDWTVDLTWECAAPNEFEDVAPPQGYTFSLATLGCPGGYPQKFVLRPNAANSPTWMSIALYGAVSDPDWVPLTGTNDGYAFTWSKAGLVVEGRIISLNAQTGAEVAIDSVTWGSAAVCDADTYTFPPEE